MKIEVKITDESGNINQYVIGGYSLADEEIEEYAKGVYGEEGEIWKRITNSFIIGAKWARDVLNARQCSNTSCLGDFSGSFSMDDLRKFKNVYHVEVIGDAGGWLDFVIADNADDAITKVRDVYGQYHKNLQVSIMDNYDYYIE